MIRKTFFLSTLIHAGIFLIGSINPQAVLYPINDAPQSIDVILINEENTIKQLAEENILTTPVANEDAYKENITEVKKDPKENVVEEQHQGVDSEAVADTMYNLPPAYPLEARRKGIEGRVELAVLVNADGFVQEVNVKSSSGYIMLDKAAVKAVHLWKFKPAMMAGVSLASTVIVPIEFQLTDE